MNKRGVGFYLNKVGANGCITDDRPNTNSAFEEASLSQAEKQNQFNPSNVSTLSYKWFKAEYFYSHADRLFFLDNELNLALEGAELPNVFTSQEWAIVRQALRSSTSYPEDNYEKPKQSRRLFSNYFI